MRPGPFVSKCQSRRGAVSPRPGGRSFQKVIHRAMCCLLMLSPMGELKAETLSPAAVLQELRSFNELGGVLYVAAHPDDENTQMIAYLARGRHYRTAYLSLTRGDGGQNVLRADFDERLGVARTQELLAARKLDGGRQFFTRAVDFGFSKDYEETLRIWNKEEVLADMVRIIRHFQPDVIVTRFSPQPGGTHGHHTASAVLAREAFKLAADANAFAEQLTKASGSGADGLKPWQAKRLFMNGRGGGDGLRMEVGGEDPVSGASLNELAMRSRAMHKTQGFDNFRGFGGGGPRTESLVLLDGEPATNGIMDGIETSWKRVPGGERVAALAAELIQNFNSTNLPANVPSILRIRSELSRMGSTPVVEDKRRQLDKILAACLGLQIRTTVANAEVVPGEQFSMKHSASINADLPVRWVAVRHAGGTQDKAVELKPGAPASRESKATLPKDSPLSHPYWLREDRKTGTFQVQDLSLIVEPENPAVFPVEHAFEVAGQTFTLADEPLAMAEGSPDGRRLDVIPPVSMSFGSSVAVFHPGGTRELEVQLVASRDSLSGSVKLEIPDGWKVTPAERPFRLAKRGDRETAKFTVTAPARSTAGRLVAAAKVGNAVWRHERVEVSYAHLPLQLLHPLAAIRAVSFEHETRGRSIGYIPGAGDQVADALRELGYSVSLIEEPELDFEKLSKFDAVVVGVRAFNVRPKLAEQMPVLLRYVEQGGTVVAQYNTADRNASFGPLDLRLSRERVTDENAAMTFLAPDHAVLNKPNKVTEADFSGWVQERGLYFPTQWGDPFVPILGCGDPGERALQGGLLVAQLGKGHFVYTGLSFFRQLPAGVPGAYRLFANLVSLGKQ